MANYDLDIQSYHKDHLILWQALTLVSAAGYRYCDVSSSAEHTVTVRDGNTRSCVLYLRQSDLYIVGFKNGSNTVFGFQDQQPANVSCTQLGMFVNYAKVGSTAKGTAIKRSTIQGAIDAFDGHAGTSWGPLELPFLAMALLVSEAMRFYNIHAKMRQVVNDRSDGASTTFNTWSSVVTSWSNDTKGLHKHPKLMNKPSQYNLRTWHHFDR